MVQPRLAWAPDPISIDIERPYRPTSLKIEPISVNLDVGQRIPLQVIGTYADGSSVRLTHSTQTTFVSKSPGIATVTEYGLVTAIGPGSTRIFVDRDFPVSVTVHPGRK